MRSHCREQEEEDTGCYILMERDQEVRAGGASVSVSKTLTLQHLMTGAYPGAGLWWPNA